MNDLAVRRNVTSRLDDAEDMAGALVIRCDALLMAGKALSDRVQALENEHAVEAQRLTMLRDHYIAFRALQVTVWQRLRWVFRG